MVYYTPTPDYYQDYIEHGWLKDQAAKVHKYIERWRGKNGKWYYRYATDKAKQLGDKASKVGKNIKNKVNKVTINAKGYLRNKKGINQVGKHLDIAGENTIKANRGYTSSNSASARRAAGNRWSQSTYTNGITAGRKRAATNKAKESNAINRSIDADTRRGKDKTTQTKSAKAARKTYLDNRGYSTSKGSIDNNAATNASASKLRTKHNLSGKGYGDSRKAGTLGVKKEDLGLRGYESSRSLYDRDDRGRLNNYKEKKIYGGTDYDRGKYSPASQDILNRIKTNQEISKERKKLYKDLGWKVEGMKEINPTVRTPEEKRRRVKTRSSKHNL